MIHTYIYKISLCLNRQMIVYNTIKKKNNWRVYIIYILIWKI